MIEWLILTALLALIPALIARSRGLSPLTWWIYGVLVLPVAIVHVFFATPASVQIARRAPAPRETPPRPLMTMIELQEAMRPTGWMRKER